MELLNKRIMKKIFIFLLLFISINVLAQKEQKKMSLNLLELKDESFIKDLQTLMEKESISKFEEDYFYSLNIKKDPEMEDIYLLSLFSLPLELIYKSKNMVFFYLNNIPIIVTDGCNPYNIFSKTKKTKEFVYDAWRSGMIFPEDYSEWYILYMYKTMHKINLPALYISRLGFEPCI